MVGVDVKVLIKKLKKVIIAEFTTYYLLLYFAYCTSLRCNLIELDGQKEAEKKALRLLDSPDWTHGKSEA
jgi:ferritin-like protein